jgi:hypothetical protein
VSIFFRTMDLSPKDLRNLSESATEVSPSMSGTPLDGLFDSWTDRAPLRAPPAPAVATRPPKPYAESLSLLAAEVTQVVTAFPDDTPPAVLCHALGYVLHTKWNWRVKCCCQPGGTKLPTSMPKFWLQAVLVVQIPEGPLCLVDVCFREKFMARIPGGHGQHILDQTLDKIPVVLVGTLGDALREVNVWAAALGAIFDAAGAKLPPWRSHLMLGQLYTFCTACPGGEFPDGTSCGGHLSACESRLDGEHLGFLLAAMHGVRMCHGSQSPRDDDDDDYAFDKEPPAAYVSPANSELHLALRTD